MDGRQRLINEKEIIEIFEEYGYRIVNPEDMTYAQQVELFSKAKCVVGASGAGFTNVIYCNPGTVVGCIVPRKYNFCAFATLAEMVGCKSLFLDAKVKIPGITFSTDKYSVNKSEVVNYIMALEKLCG